MSRAATTPGEMGSAEPGPAWANGVRAVAVLTGAGISTDSGIPDFRGPQGVWTRNPGAQQLFTHQKAGTPAERVFELHGSMFSVVCVSCGGRALLTQRPGG